MKEYLLILKAADAAARWHVDQRRKGAAREPYVNHLLEVASLVAEATDGQDPELIAAALLHDAIEDQKVPDEIVERDFGPKVLALIREVTDDKTLDKATRKRLQIEKANTKSFGAKLIKLADKTSNLRSVATSPAPEWSNERRLDYIEWSKQVVAGMRGTSQWLEDRFDEAARNAEHSIGGRRVGPDPAGPENRK